MERTDQPPRPAGPGGLDLDDTSRCPRPEACASCASVTGVEIATVSTPMGVYCLGICGGCVEANRLPALDWPTTAHRVAEHCEHVGCDLDEMAAALQPSDGAQ